MCDKLLITFFKKIHIFRPTVLSYSDKGHLNIIFQLLEKKKNLFRSSLTKFMYFTKV